MLHVKVRLRGETLHVPCEAFARQPSEGPLTAIELRGCTGDEPVRVFRVEQADGQPAPGSLVSYVVSRGGKKIAAEG